ncbi:MAG: hypothetical protein O3B22_17530 [Proteobacteria bacterium]|nr:hypothetical protein [Pseudomonadota bacterium]
MDTAPEMSVSEAAVNLMALEVAEFTARPVAPQESDLFLDRRYCLDDLAALALDVTHRGQHVAAHRDWLDRHGLVIARSRRRVGVLLRNGRRLLAIPAYDPWTPDSPWLLDVVVMDPDMPEQLQTVTGRAVILGDLGSPLWQPVRFHVDALSWARAGGEGVCVIDWTAARPLLVGRGLQLVVGDVRTGNHVENALRAVDALPHILVEAA